MVSLSHNSNGADTMNRLINMLLRRAVNMAVREGINAGARTFAGPKDGQAPTTEQKAAMRRARQSTKMMRRITRF